MPTSTRKHTNAFNKKLKRNCIPPLFNIKRKCIHIFFLQTYIDCNSVYPPWQHDFRRMHQPHISWKTTPQYTDTAKRAVQHDAFLISIYYNMYKIAWPVQMNEVYLSAATVKIRNDRLNISTTSNINALRARRHDLTFVVT